MAPGSLIMERSGTVALAAWLNSQVNKYRLAVQVNALPAYGTQAQICYVKMERNVRLLFGAVGMGWSTTSSSSPRMSPPNTLPWDGVPGGTQNVERGGSIGDKGLSIYVVVNVIYDIDFNFSQHEFSFVPLTSSLDVQNVNMATFSQPFLFPANGSLNGSRADKYIAQEKLGSNYNIPHTDFTARNSRWIYDQMEGNDYQVDCEDFCENSMSINGTDQICSSATYKVNGLIPGATVTWSASPSNMVVFDCVTCPQTTVTRNSTGTVTISAVVSGCGGGAPITILKSNIRVGAPSISSYKVIGPGTVYSGAGYYYSVSSVGVPAPVNIYWSVPAGWTITNGQGTESISVWTGSAGGVVAIYFDNFCGEPTGTYKTVVIGTGGGVPQFTGDGTNTLKLTPNPANGNVTVSLLTNTTKMNSGFNPVITEIKVIDKVGTVRKRFTFNNRSASQLIDISGLPVDTYVIQAFTGTQWLSAKLLIVNN